MTGGARPGRRDNGLVAAAYTAAADVDRRLGERVLGVLGAAGIPAYLQQGRRPGVERLYVAQDQVAAAHERLRALAADPHSAADVTEGPAEGGRDQVDAAFADIVAGYHLSADAPHDRAPAEPADPPRTRVDLGPYGGGPQEPTLLDAFDTFGADLPDADDDERFVPPPPPPLPKVAKATVAGVAAVVGGLVVLLSPGLLSFLDPTVATLLGVGLLFTGAGTLVSRLRSPDDDGPRDPDDGAVV